MKRREFIIRNGLLSIGTLLIGISRSEGVGQDKSAEDWTVRQDFPGAGGVIDKLDRNGRKIHFRPHHEQGGGWGQVWWYFKVEGLTPGDVITLELAQDIPPGEGIAPQAYFSKDRQHWEMTERGEKMMVNGAQVVVYKQVVTARTLWFAYNIPYLADQYKELVQRVKKQRKEAEVVELCRTRGGRSVPLIQIGRRTGTRRPHVWLQARAHAFESGSSWVLHELTVWLLSDDPEAKRLRSAATFTILPVIDVDGVEEGRTGKNHPPHDHNRDWQDVPPHWQEVAAIKGQLEKLINDGSLALFIDIHGPANQSHPYFICPSDPFLSKEQKEKQMAFLETLGARQMTKEAQKTQSMNQFHYTLRESNPLTAPGWAINHTTPEVIALTLEVNMNTPLSTREGYREQGVTLGRGIARYFG